MTAARYPRTSCVVPFCPRTSTLFAGEWVCGEHWRLIDRSLKLLRTRLNKRWRRKWQTCEVDYWKAREIVDKGPPGTVSLDLPGTIYRWRCVERAWRRGQDGIWRRMKRQAIERAMGITA